MPDTYLGTPATSNDPLFDSAWLKVTHALGHTRALFDDIEAFEKSAGSNPVGSVRAEYDARRHGFAVYPIDVAATPTRWGLVLGDIAHNFRSSLDHLAWALVCRGKTPPDILSHRQRQQIYFPITDKHENFNKQLATKLPGVKRGDIAIVRRRQPYNYRRPNRDRHFLAILNLLNNGDKHRTLQPVWVYPTFVGVEVWRMQDCIVTQKSWPRRKGPLSTDSELTFIRAKRRGDNPHLEVRVDIRTEPSIEQRLSVKSWIITCTALTSILLNEFSKPPDEAHDRDLWNWFAARANEDVAAAAAARTQKRAKR